MSSIKVINPGLLTMVQDEGRYGYQRFGVPVAGVFDRFAARIANWLVGNDTDAAVLEATFVGPGLLAADCTLQAAITGGRTTATLDGNPVPQWETFTWRAGQVLNLGSVTAGARVYLAIGGGIQVPPVMGSRATYVRAEIGGYQGRKLQKDDELPTDPVIVAARVSRLPLAFRPQLTDEHCLRVVLGPQRDHFSDEAIQAFLAAEYRVAAASDRMGIRLQGPAVMPLNPDIVSDAIAYGSVQVPKDGNPIIMGPDRQTTGGYPKIATVLEYDMNQLAQAKPGDVVRFTAVSVRDAQEIASSVTRFYSKIGKILTGEITGREYKVTVSGRTYYSFCERE